MLAQVLAVSPKKSNVLKNPIRICNSLIYITDTVLMPTFAESAIPAIQPQQLLAAIVPSYGRW